MSHSGGLAGLAVGGRKEASHVKSPRLARGGPGASAPTRSKSPSGSATSPCVPSRPTALRNRSNRSDRQARGVIFTVFRGFCTKYVVFPDALAKRAPWRAPAAQQATSGAQTGTVPREKLGRGGCGVERTPPRHVAFRRRRPRGHIGERRREDCSWQEAGNKGLRAAPPV
jgi:hypothetical protein